MPGITVHPQPLRAASSDCHYNVLNLVDVAKRAFADAESSASRAVCDDTNGMLKSAAAAQACVTNWLAEFEDASRTMGAVSGKLAATAAAVVSTDADAADLYLGPTAKLSPITIDLGGE